MPLIAGRGCRFLGQAPTHSSGAAPCIFTAVRDYQCSRRPSISRLSFNAKISPYAASLSGSVLSKPALPCIISIACIIRMVWKSPGLRHARARSSDETYGVPFALSAVLSPNSAEATLHWGDYEMIDWERVVTGELRASSYCVRKVRRPPPTAAAVDPRIRPCGASLPRFVWRRDGGAGTPFPMFWRCAGVKSEAAGRNPRYSLVVLVYRSFDPEGPCSTLAVSVRSTFVVPV